MRLALLLLTTLLAACDKPPVREFDSVSAYKYLEQQVGFGFRIPGSAGHTKTAAWLDSLLHQRTDSVVIQRWDHVTVKGDTLHLTNFIARYNPGASERILYLAHWDTRPVSDNPEYKGDRSKPVPGASDGASGVAVLLGIADVLKRVPPTVGVDLLFVDGEDYGDFNKDPADVLMGSRYFAAHQPAGVKPLYAILFDMVGDKNLNIKQEGNSLLGAPDVVELVWTTAREIGHGQYFLAGPGPTLTDDHVELQKVGIRAIDMVDFDYPYWHTPDDTIDKTSAASLQIVGDVGLALIRRH